MHFVRSCRMMKMFDISVKCRDSIALELLYIKFLPVWVATGRTKYVNLTLDTIKNLYKSMSFQDLMTFRTNLGIILRKSTSLADFNAQAEDYLIEMINLRDKMGKEAKSEQPWLLLSMLVGVTWRACHFVDQYYRRWKWNKTTKRKNISKTVKPRATIEKRAVYEFFCFMSISHYY